MYSDIHDYLLYEVFMSERCRRMLAYENSYHQNLRHMCFYRNHRDIRGIVTFIKVSVAIINNIFD